MTRGQRRLRQRHADDGQDPAATSVHASSPIAISNSDSDDTKPPPRKAALHADQKQWSCPSCTYLNGSDAVNCSMCQQIGPVQQASTGRMSSWLTPQQSQPMTSERDDKVNVEMIDSSSDSDSSMRPSQSSTLESMPSKDLWSASHSPTSVDQLCVNKRKLTELRQWLMQNAVPLSHKQKRLLFVCGPPGIGKSTSVRLLCEELGIQVREWKENGNAGRMHFDRLLEDDIFRLPYTSNVDDFHDFVHRSTSYPGLPLTSSRNTPDKSSRKRARDGSNNRSLAQKPQIVLLENWPEAWAGNSDKKRQYEERIRHAFQQIVETQDNSANPVLCVFSDVREKKVDEKYLAKRFSSNVVRSPFTDVLHINPVTTAQLQKHIKRIAKEHGKTLSTGAAADIAGASQGDLRHAINALQLRLSVRSSKSSLALQKDGFPSDMHLIGKLVHGKELSTEEGQDQLLEASPMSLETILSYVHENCIDHFTDVEDYAEAMEWMSSMKDMLERSYQAITFSQAREKTRDVTRAILSGLVKVTNQHPAPKAFCPIRKPQATEMNRSMETSNDAANGNLEETNGQRIPWRQVAYACSRNMYYQEIAPFHPFLHRPRKVEEALDDTATSFAEVELVEEISDTDDW